MAFQLLQRYSSRRNFSAVAVVYGPLVCRWGFAVCAAQNQRPHWRAYGSGTLRTQKNYTYLMTIALYWSCVRGAFFHLFLAFMGFCSLGAHSSSDSLTSCCRIRFFPLAFIVCVCARDFCNLLHLRCRTNWRAAATGNIFTTIALFFSIVRVRAHRTG